jgi:hypothetical protein
LNIPVAVNWAEPVAVAGETLIACRWRVPPPHAVSDEVPARVTIKANRETWRILRLRPPMDLPVINPGFQQYDSL